MTKRILVLWDIDGTLIVTRNAGSRAMEVAFARHFGRTGDLSTIDWAGRTDTWLTPEILRRNGIEPTAEACAAYLETYVPRCPANSPRARRGACSQG